MAEEEIYTQKGTKAWRTIDAGVYLLLVIMIALAIRCYVFEPVRVDGSSMVPTLTHNEYMFVEKVSYWLKMPERGDILICFYPGYKESCVKRVIGLPGEYVSVSDGRILINGVPLDESEYWNDVIYDDYAGTTVGDRQVFVVGDNRNGSKDSRNESVGCIPMSKVVGKVRAVVFPLSRFRIIRGATYP